MFWELLRQGVTATLAFVVSSMLAMGTGLTVGEIFGALVVAMQSFSEPEIAMMVVVVAILGLVTLMPLAECSADGLLRRPS